MYITDFNSFMDILPYLCGGQAKVCIDDQIQLWTMAEIETKFVLPPANEVWGKIIVIHLSVILFMGRGCLPHCMLEYKPPDTHTHPWTNTPPLGRHTAGILWDTVNMRAVSILLECILVSIRFTAKKFQVIYQSSSHSATMTALLHCAQGPYF